jgi:hypothetical protein
MNSYLGKKGYTIYKTNLEQKQIKKIHNELNVKPQSHMVQTIEYSVYRESQTKLYIPRYYGLDNFGECENKLPKGDSINISFNLLFLLIEASYLGRKI